MAPKKKGKKGGESSELLKDSDAVVDIVQPIATEFVDPITDLAHKHWLPLSTANTFDPRIVDQIFETELSEVSSTSRLHLLDLSNYLENYLWKFFYADAPPSHIVSIVIMLNEKYREGIDVSSLFSSSPSTFESFFQAVVKLSHPLNDSLESQYRPSVILLLINIYKCLENSVVRQTCLKFLSLPIWNFLSKVRLSHELSSSVQLSRHWDALQSADNSQHEGSNGQGGEGDDQTSKNNKRGSSKKSLPTSSKKAKVEKASSVNNDSVESSWFPSLVTQFLNAINDFDINSCAWFDMLYFERFVELLIDLLSQLPTRRFLNTLLDDRHVIVRCKQSSLYTHVNGKLYSQLIDILESYIHYEVNDQTGQELTHNIILSNYNTKLYHLQHICYVHYRDVCQDIIFSSTGELGKVCVYVACYEQYVLININHY
jgi:intron-binding protein aquarius